MRKYSTDPIDEADLERLNELNVEPDWFFYNEDNSWNNFSRRGFTDEDKPWIQKYRYRSIVGKDIFRL